MEEDFALSPEWVDEMGQLGDPVCSYNDSRKPVGPVSKFQCVPVPNSSTATQFKVAHTQPPAWSTARRSVRIEDDSKPDDCGRSCSTDSDCDQTMACNRCENMILHQCVT